MNKKEEIGKAALSMQYSAHANDEALLGYQQACFSSHHESTRVDDVHAVKDSTGIW